MATDAVRSELSRSQPREGEATTVRGVELPRRVQLIPLVVLALGCGLTAASFGGSWVDLAYRLPRMHAVIDTAIGLGCLLLAYLVFGRLQVLGSQRDYALALALGFGGFVNLVAAITQGVSSEPAGHFGVWAPTIGNVIVALLFAAAALTPEAPMARSVTPARFLFASFVTCAAYIAVVAVAAPHLPWSEELAFSPTDASKPLFVGPSILLVNQGVIAIAYAVAGWQFSRRRDRRDDLVTWLASSCLLFALASVDYLAFPSIYSDWIYVGDILRLAAVVLLLVGAAREISGYGRERVAMEERRRVARDLHDGVAQELAYIATMARRLERDPSDRDVHRLADAAQHALDESRLVISTLAGAGNSSEQLALTARDAAHRHGIELELHLPGVVTLPPDVIEALLRIVREAVNNAGRHAGATVVSVSVEVDERITLEIADNGRGFDVAQPSGGFGLTSMRERAEAIGGSFTLTAAPGGGTTIRVEIA